MGRTLTRQPLSTVTGMRRPPSPTVAGARLAQGKPLSFNNIADADAALQCVRALGMQPACVIVKHSNPCGAAVAETGREAYERAFRTDPTSAFGGIIAFNRPLGGDLARAVLERQFVEVIVAPRIADEGAAVLAARPDVRVPGLRMNPRRRSKGPPEAGKRISTSGRCGAESWSRKPTTTRSRGTISRSSPAGPHTPSELTDLLFAWRIAWFVKSNAIVYARGGATYGIGRGSDEPRVLGSHRAPPGAGGRARPARHGHGLRCVLSVPRRD